MYGHVINFPTHVNVKSPEIGGHLPNADTDSRVLVVRTSYNGQYKPNVAFLVVMVPQTVGDFFCLQLI